MPYTNPFRMAVDLGMILAFALTALFVLFPGTPPVLADATFLTSTGTESPASTGLHAVTAAGKATVSIEPNVATATIGVEVLSPTVKEATSAAQAVMEDIWAALVAQNIDESDIRISHLNIFAERLGPGGLLNENQARYHASNTFLITIRDLDSIDAVLDAAIDAGANNIYSVDFSLPDPAAVESEARADAVPRRQN
ncbi:MAG: SIMPL domain-containing protein [Caldilineaceae bacterium]|nr:SIMPL domain-containing protein [Caldilineaceae bacterium]